MARTEIHKLVLSAYDARVAGDLERTLSYFHPDAEFAVNGAGTDFPRLGERAKGAAAVRAVLADMIKAFRLDNWRSTSLTVEDCSAVLTWRADVVFTATGASETLDVVDVIRFQDGKIISLQQHTDTAKLAKLLSRRVGPA